MMTVLSCLGANHDPLLLVLAVLVCAIGSFCTIRLHRRAIRARGTQRAGWHFLAAVAAGTAIWCTHFVAMLGYDPGLPIAFDPVLTIASLLIAILGGWAAFVASTALRLRTAPAIGGAVLGLAVAAMHYTGMAAYRVDGLARWNLPAIAVSLLLATGFSALALHLAARPGTLRDRLAAAAALMTGILSLHFLGMSALTVEPLALRPAGADAGTLLALAISVSLVALIVIGAALASWAIDNQSQAEAGRALRSLSLTDILTDLPNRDAFHAHLERGIGMAWNGQHRLLLLSLDLDGFRGINEAHGHAAGDAALRQVARHLAEALRPGEFAARIGADEFVALKALDDSVPVEEALAAFVDRLRGAVGTPFLAGGALASASASIGAALFPEHAETPGDLINRAGLARARAKSGGPGRCQTYDPSLEEAARARRALVGDLREALPAGQLSLHYQPQVAVTDGALQGFEALLRWTHPVRGSVSPAEFIPLAEEHGLIAPIGHWVLRQACADAASWAQPLGIAVNLSPAQLADPALPDAIADTLRETGLDPARLELELTETMILGDRARALEGLSRIRALGVHIALDDFGTGYSSLDTLRAFPFSRIKLDRSFMREVEASPQAVAIIRAVLALGRSLGIRVLAEGIETEGQHAILRQEGCDEAQGYLHGRPAPMGALLAEGRLSLRASAVPVAA